jgi:hypothetical protein
MMVKRYMMILKNYYGGIYENRYKFKRIIFLLGINIITIIAFMN